MNHQRHAHRFKRRAGQFRAVRRGRSRHGAAFHMRKIHPRLLEYRAVFQHPALARAQLALPFIGHKARFTLLGFKRGTNVFLHASQQPQHRLRVHVFSSSRFQAAIIADNANRSRRCQTKQAV